MTAVVVIMAGSGDWTPIDGYLLRLHAARVDWRRVLRLDCCAYCGQRGGTVDHIEPRALRRPCTRRKDNLTGACSWCNAAKATTRLLPYLSRTTRTET